MVGEHNPNLIPQPTPEQGLDPAVLDGIGVAQRVHQISQTLEDIDVAKRDAIFANPRVQTLIETGQITTADALARDDATSTTELPRVRARKRPRKPRGSSYPDPITGQDVSRQLANEAAETEEHVPLSEAGKAARDEAIAQAHRDHWKSISTSPEFLRLPLTEQRARAMAFGQRRIQRRV